jgi:hypothetical protein
VARAALLCLLFVGWLATAAGASPVAGPAPVARQRVVLADPDPELRHAMEQVLAPWHLEVVIEGPPPTDAAMAEQRAVADTARFVVWRDGEQLVVYDRELAFTERRDSRSGTLDPPTAAAAALTIKTMMRLPPPPPPAEVPPPAPSAPGDEPGIELRLQAGVASRIPGGGDIGMTARFGGAVEIRPWSLWGWRIGVTGDAGASTAVQRASFNGTWREWSVLGTMSWTFALDAWEIEAHAGGGIRRSTLAGTEMDTPRDESDTLACARGGAAIRRRVSRWTLGAVLDIDRSFGTPTYSKAVGAAEIFQVPAAAVQAGLAVAVDL